MIEQLDAPHDDDAPLHGNVVDLGKVRAEKEWRDRMIYDGNNKIVHCAANAITILANDDDWKDVLAENVFSGDIVTTKPPKWCTDDAQAVIEPGTWTDGDSVRTQAWLHRKWSLKLSRDNVYDAVSIVAKRRTINPVRDFIEGASWDAERRVPTWLSTYLGVEPSPYVSKVGEWFLVSAVARIMSPGCKVDTLLVLEGDQGLKKSTALRKLFSQPWFGDTPLDLEDKDRFVGLRGHWCLELAELDSINRSGIDRIKGFLSSAADTYRPPYGRGLITVPRQSVFAGTVNPDVYLRDETGNRRFWPVRCGVIDHLGLERDRELIWAEARELYLGGAKWWPEGPEENALCAAQQVDRLQQDVWLDRIAGWAARRLGESPFTVAEVLADVLHIDVGKWTQADQNRVARCLKVIGYERKQVRVQGVRVWSYVRAVTTQGVETEQVVT